MQHIVDEVTKAPDGMTASDLARRAGINRSTLHRIATGAGEPSFATIRELAIAHGLDAAIELRPLSDPAAAVAARHLLEKSFDDRPISPGVEAWVARLERVAPDASDPFAVISAAGRASSLLHRVGAIFLRGDASALRLASAASSAAADQGAWAISGAAALEHGRDSPVRGPSVLWVDDVARAVAALSGTHSAVTSPGNAQVVVAEVSPDVLVDSYLAGPIRFVAPVQMLLDGVGLGDETAEAAERIAREWSR